ncbi:MAG: glycosyltransferase family 4 protein [Actinobacteria bacterium]|nr:glycosyltransferase family 4 protein [Actinomycetota bacterium]
MLYGLYTVMPKTRISNVPNSRVHSHPVRAALRHGLRALTPAIDDQMSRFVIRGLDRWSKSRAVEADIVIGLSSFATDTLRRAGDLGRLVVCDRGSWHILEQRAVLEREHEKWGFQPPRFDPWIVSRELSDYESADLIFVPSEAAESSFVRRGVAADKLRRIPYGVDTEVFATPDRSGNGDFRVVSVGRVELQKGHQYLLEALAQIEYPAATFVGPIDHEFGRRFADQLTRVTCTGRVGSDEVARLMRQSSVFVLASVQEGLALVVLEAMASGLPVIATTATGASEFVDDGVHGYLVSPGDPDAIAAALHDLREDRDLRKRMGDAASRRAQEAGTWNSYGDSVASTLAAATRCL